MSFSSQLRGRANLYRSTRTQDGIGGVTDTWTLTISQFPCLVQAKSADKGDMSGSIGVAVTHRLYAMTQSVVPVEKDEVEVSGVRYRVKFVNNVRGHHLELDLEELRRGA